jgi:hypothetical protein
MRQILFFLIIGSLSLSGCKFINEKILKKGSDTLEVYAYNLEKQLKEQEANHQASLNQIMQESQAKLDSIIAYYEDELAARGGKYVSAASGTYYLIVGSFLTPAYAEAYSAKISGMGYKTEIVKMHDWNLVAAESYTGLRDALDGLAIVRSNITPDSWIYVGP